jgi:hypothetical protein
MLNLVKFKEFFKFIIIFPIELSIYSDKETKL